MQFWNQEGGLIKYAFVMILNYIKCYQECESAFQRASIGINDSCSIHMRLNVYCLFQQVYG